MNDHLTSVIRTYVPLAVGALVAWLTARGVDVDHETTAALTAGLTGLASAVYYGLVRAIEHRWPALGVLLGAARVPAYPPTASPGDSGDEVPEYGDWRP